MAERETPTAIVSFPDGQQARLTADGWTYSDAELAQAFNEMWPPAPPADGRYHPDPLGEQAEAMARALGGRVVMLPDYGPIPEGAVE